MSTDGPEQALALERKRRSTRKGLITRIKTSLVELQALHQDDYAASTLTDLLRDFKTHLQEYHDQHEVVVDLLNQNPAPSLRSCPHS